MYFHQPSVSLEESSVVVIKMLKHFQRFPLFMASYGMKHGEVKHDITLMTIHSPGTRWRGETRAAWPGKSGFSHCCEKKMQSYKVSSAAFLLRSAAKIKVCWTLRLHHCWPASLLYSSFWIFFDLPLSVSVTFYLYLLQTFHCKAFQEQPTFQSP